MFCFFLCITDVFRVFGGMCSGRSALDLQSSVERGRSGVLGSREIAFVFTQMQLILGLKQLFWKVFFLNIQLNVNDL